LCDSVQFDEHGCILSIRIDPATGFLSVLQELVQQRVEINRIQYGTRNLEELFLNFTQHSLRD